MKNLIESVNELGWTGLILYFIIFLLVLLFIELNDKKQEQIFINGNWVKNDYDPIGFRVFFLSCIAFGGLTLFFIVKNIVL